MNGVNADVIESDDSIVEVAKPPRTPPPLIDIEVEGELTLNVSGGSFSCIEISDCSGMTASTPETTNILSGQGDSLSPYHWTTDMKNYYNDDWGDEESFHVGKLQDGMAKAPHLWDIGNFHKESNRRSRKRAACFNCGQYGHKEKDCRPSCCYMCGNDGHSVKFCPRKICLSCGKKTNSYVNACQKCLQGRNSQCPRCHVVGHTLTDCTDHWRRFHHVITYKNVQPPAEPAHKPAGNIWCCNCGRRGHVELECRGPRDASYAPTSTLVISYERSFTVDKADNVQVADSAVCEPRSRQFFRNPASTSGTSVIESPNTSILGSSPCRKKRRYFQVMSESGGAVAAPDSSTVLPNPVSNPSSDILIVREKICNKGNKRRGTVSVRLKNDIVVLSQLINAMSEKKSPKKKKPKKKKKRALIGGVAPAIVNSGLEMSSRDVGVNNVGPVPVTASNEGSQLRENSPVGVNHMAPVPAPISNSGPEMSRDSSHRHQDVTRVGPISVSDSGSRNTTHPPRSNRDNVTKDSQINKPTPGGSQSDRGAAGRSNQTDRSRRDSRPNFHPVRDDRRRFQSANTLRNTRPFLPGPNFLPFQGDWRNGVPPVVFCPQVAPLQPNSRPYQGYKTQRPLSYDERRRYFDQRPDAQMRGNPIGRWNNFLMGMNR